MEKVQVEAVVHREVFEEGTEPLHQDILSTIEQNSGMQSPAILDHGLNINQEDQSMGTASMSMKCEILKELTKIFNKRVEEFFINEFDDKLEALVEAKVSDIFNQSGHNTSALNHTFSKSDLESRLIKLEETAETKMDKINTKIDDLAAEINEKNSYIESLMTEMEKLKVENGQLIKENIKLHGKKITDKMPEGYSASTEQRISLLEKKVDNCAVGLDNQEQNSRKEILELKGIPNMGNSRYPEDVYDVVKNFFSHYLDISVRTYDISIAHRQFNPGDKKKYGKEYIPSIYVKFVNRHLALKILKARSLLKNCRNRYGGKFYIQENLTLNRRLLWDSVENKLDTYRYKWIKNGDIYVKKVANSKPIKIKSDHVLDELISEQNISKQCALSRKKDDEDGIEILCSSSPSENSNVPPPPSRTSVHPMRHSLMLTDKVIEDTSTTYAEALVNDGCMPPRRHNYPPSNRQHRNSLFSPGILSSNFYSVNPRFTKRKFNNRSDINSSSAIHFNQFSSR